jgi:hypothetical protein
MYTIKHSQEEVAYDIIIARGGVPIYEQIVKQVRKGLILQGSLPDGEGAALRRSARPGDAHFGDYQTRLEERSGRLFVSVPGKGLSWPSGPHHLAREDTLRRAEEHLAKAPKTDAWARFLEELQQILTILYGRLTL